MDDTMVTVMTLKGLRSAWINWDFVHFMDNFFINRFPQYKDRKDEWGSYVCGGYPREKWDKFTANPVSYMCNMDDDTLKEFAKALEKEALRESERI